jgi:hypothetical protein
MNRFYNDPDGNNIKRDKRKKYIDKFKAQLWVFLLIQSILITFLYAWWSVPGAVTDRYFGVLSCFSYLVPLSILETIRQEDENIKSAGIGRMSLLIISFCSDLTWIVLFCVPNLKTASQIFYPLVTLMARCLIAFNTIIFWIWLFVKEK